MIQQFSFEYPYVLVLLLLFILLHFLLQKQKPSYYIPSIIGFLPTHKHKTLLNAILKWSFLTSLIVALASPILTKEIADKSDHTLDIVLSLDTSGSMSLNGFNELDYNQSRWSVVQEVASDFIQTRKKDRIALVVFGDTSSVASPLSYNMEAPLEIIKKVDIGLVGKSTALTDSLLTSAMLLEHSLSSTKLIILLSDGDDTASKIPLEIVLKILNKYKIKVYTIAIGESNNNLLKLITSSTHTQSFSASNKKDLSRVYAQINALVAKTHNLSTRKVITYLYTYVLLFGLVSALLLALRQRKSEVL